MVTALKDFTLYGSRVTHGSPLGDLWGRCNKRLRAVLQRNRFVGLQPVSAAESPATPTRVPRTADGPSRPRGRPRKGA